MRRVAVIILNCNGLDDTIECLRSVYKMDYSEYQIIVVDNGSTDGSPDMIRKFFPDVKLIQNETNRGFADGNNIGIEYALSRGTDYLLMLNNDTVVDPGILRTLLSEARRRPEAGVFGAKVYFYSESERIWFAGGKWRPREGHCVVLGWGELDTGGTYNSVVEVDYVSGCAMFFRESVPRRIGLLASDFFLTFEDTDWCYRARKDGIKCLMVPAAKVWHKVSASFGGKSPLYNYFFTRNRLLWAKRDLSLMERSFVYVNVIKELTLLGAQWRGHVQGLQVKARLLGVRDYFLGRLGSAPDDVEKLNRRFFDER
jgi:GT2 family glycosyltransferase